jgi:hypothetical protein
MRASNLTSTTLGLSLALTAILTVLSFAVWGRAVALGVLFGGSLMLANFQVLRWTLGRFLSGGRRGTGVYLAIFVIKFALLAVLLSLLIWSKWVDVLGLFLGCSVVVLAVLGLAPVLGAVGLKDEGENGERH